MPENGRRSISGKKMPENRTLIFWQKNARKSETGLFGLPLWTVIAMLGSHFLAKNKRSDASFADGLTFFASR